MMLFFLSARSVSASSSSLSSTSRIILLSMSGGLCRSSSEVEGRALQFCAFGPYPAAVLMDNALHGGKADAVACKLGHPVQALERAEQLADEGHIEAGPVVAHEIDGVAVLLPRAELDAGSRLFR